MSTFWNRFCASSKKAGPSTGLQSRKDGGPLLLQVTKQNKLQNIRGNILWVLVLFEGLVNVKFANKKISHVV
jgi:hypothetical protein